MFTFSCVCQISVLENAALCCCARLYRRMSGPMEGIRTEKENGQWFCVTLISTTFQSVPRNGNYHQNLSPEPIDGGRRNRPFSMTDSIRRFLWPEHTEINKDPIICSVVRNRTQEYDGTHKELIIGSDVRNSLPEYAGNFTIPTGSRWTRMTWVYETSDS